MRFVGCITVPEEDFQRRTAKLIGIYFYKWPDEVTRFIKSKHLRVFLSCDTDLFFFFIVGQSVSNLARTGSTHIGAAARCLAASPRRAASVSGLNAPFPSSHR